MMLFLKAPHLCRACMTYLWHLTSAQRIRTVRVKLKVNDMEFDAGVKLILLPKEHSSFDIISLPLGDTQKKLLATSEQLYELREVHGSSEYDAHPEPRLPSGGPVKSIILESKDSNQGAILKDPTLTTCTPFNIVYYVLNAMYIQKDNYTTRYQTLDDILDDLRLSPCHDTLFMKIKQCLTLICTSIQENGDEFFKLSIEKAFRYISTKVEVLKNLLTNSPNFVLTGNIRATLCVSGETPAPEIVDLQTTRYCIDMIFGSYLSESVKCDYLEHMLVDYSSLNSYFKEIESKKRVLAAIEDNMESVVLITKKAKTKSTKGKNTRKPVKKVPIGKGALDSFFGKT